MDPNTEKTQRERFEETARQLECDKDEAKFEAVLKKIIKAKPDTAKDKK